MGPGSLAFGDPAPWLWILGADGVPLKWNPATGELDAKPTIAATEIVQSLWLPDRSGVLVSLADNGLELWRLDTGQRVKRYEVEVGRVCFALAVSADERTLYLGRYDATLVAAGLPLFLDWQRGAAGELLVQAHGTTVPIRWDATTEPGGWSAIQSNTTAPLSVSTTGTPMRWYRAAIE
jgi:hypothetical protein